MRIGTKGRYALTIMFYLAKNYNEGKYVSLKEISENENISFKYLEKIMVDLNKNNYLDVQRGHNGGYRLKKDPKEYTLGEIIRRVEGNIEVVPCAGNGVCEKEKKCISYPFFVGLNNEINNYIDSKTLDDYI